MISIFSLEKNEIKKLLAGKVDVRIEGKNLDYLLYGDDEKILDALGEYRAYVYSISGKPLVDTFCDIVKEYEIKFSVAESLTGGMIADRIIAVPGISDYMKEGIVCYSNESKHLRLGVDNSLFSTVGAVSEEVAMEMVKGQTEYGVSLAMSTTGIAGPTGYSLEKPCGLTYIGTKLFSEIVVNRYVFSGDRQAVREKATNVCIGNAVVLLMKRLNVELN